jgi:hypothetical protein
MSVPAYSVNTGELEFITEPVRLNTADSSPLLYIFLIICFIGFLVILRRRKNASNNAVFIG